VETVFERGWSNLENGALLTQAEESFDLLITTDQQLRYQQNLAGRKLKIIVLTSTSWPRIKPHVKRVIETVGQIDETGYLEIKFPS